MANHSRPKTALIAAMDRQRLIGADGDLPWHLPEDLKLFRRLTTGNTVIMGRRTAATLGRPLPERHNIVISKTLVELAGFIVCRNFPQALAAARRPGRPVFFIGGASIYQQALDIVEEMHISWVEGEYRGDTWFPEIDFSRWQVVEEEQYAGFCYIRYRRKS